MMSRNLLEKAALSLSLVILGSAAWFWVLQVQDVLDTLRLAYG